jgi:hypothetical protein
VWGALKAVCVAVPPEDDSYGVAVDAHRCFGIHLCVRPRSHARGQ